MKKVISIVLVLTLVMMMFVACGKSQQGSSASPSTGASSSTSVASAGKSTSYSKQWNIGCIYSEITGDFWGIVYNGCMKALDELAAYGIQGYCIAPANSNDYTLQYELLDAAKVKGVDGITLSPVNADSVGSYITDFFKDDDGFPIVVIDRSLNTTSKWVVSEVMADTMAMGKECGKLAKEAAGDKGKYVLIGILAANKNWANRSMGAMEYLDQNSNMTNAYTSGDKVWWAANATDEQTFQFVQDQCTSHPKDPITFITSTEGYTNKVIAAIGELSARPTDAPINIVGYDFSKTGYTYLKGGQMYAAVGQNPYMMGYSSTYALVNYLETGKIDSFVAVPFTVVTQTNMETDEVKAYFKSMNLSL